MFAPLIKRANPSPSSAKSKRTDADAGFHADVSNRDVSQRQAQKASGMNSQSQEREAESAARAVLNRSSSRPNVTASSPAAANSMGPAEMQPAVESLNSQSNPIDSRTAGFMEARFGHSFSRVRIHDNSVAHNAASALNARAFALGEHIVFGAGQYAPRTRAGMSLLAHELTHVVQESGNPSAALHCAPTLSGRKPGELIEDKIAPDIDKALAESSLAKYIKKTASGHLHVEFKKTFEKNLAANEKAFGSKSSSNDGPDQVAGFTDLKSGEIHLKERLANIEGALHETIHLNSKLGTRAGVSAFQDDFGNPLEEGVTQYFTNKVLAEQKLAAGAAYPEQLKLANQLISAVGEDLIIAAYFKGEKDAVNKVIAASNKHGDYAAWLKSTRSQDPKDWPEISKQLKLFFQ
ncbi:MAG TPA: DUF4157 domain-containing protein [Candidatus Angelobacter sp.]|nr:DUF4157 domain-containing protein [Candidatus Angelobacter sp.]